MDHNEVWAVIPVKPFDEGKSRLELASETRAAINRAFLNHVLTTVAQIVRSERIVVVSRDDAALAVARRAGARGVREHYDQLNDALAQGARYAGQRGAIGILSIFADLPHLVVEDVAAMLCAFDGHNLVIAPDEVGSGSNALVMPTNALPYRHGADSLWKHLDAARQAGVAFSIVRRSGLMRDVDTPAQLSDVPRSSARATLARRY